MGILIFHYFMLIPFIYFPKECFYFHVHPFPFTFLLVYMLCLIFWYLFNSTFICFLTFIMSLVLFNLLLFYLMWYVLLLYIMGIPLIPSSTWNLFLKWMVGWLHICLFSKTLENFLWIDRSAVHRQSCAFPLWSCPLEITMPKHHSYS